MSLESGQLSGQLKMNRRHFLKSGAASSGGLLLALHLPGCSSVPPGEVEGSLRPNAWLEVTPDNRVLFTLDRVEMGQGTMTGLTTLVAEEMALEPDQIEVVFAPAGKDYIVQEFGLQITGASASLRTSWQPLREAGASCRALLVTAAAQVWAVNESDILTSGGECRHKGSNRALTYGELASLAASQPLPSEVPLKAASEFRLIGKQNQRLDAKAKSFGQAHYGIDSEQEGLVYAVLSRAPSAGASLASVDASAAEAMPGVLKVVETPLGVGVIAETYWQARQAQSQLKLEWQDGPLKGLSTASVFAQYAQDLDQESGDTVRKEGDLDSANEQASAYWEAEYRAPYLAHATLEPQNCTAWIHEGRCDVWAPTQGPDIAKYVARRASGLAADDIHIHQTLLGGGFGRRLNQDYVSEAVELAKHIDRPVKLIWSREEDTQHDLYRPASLHRFRAALDSEGKAISWHHRIACPRVIDHYAKDAAGALSPDWSPHGMVSFAAKMAPLISPDVSAIEGAEDVPYGFEHIRVEHVLSDPGVPITYWRAVGHSFNGFMVETFIDELAHQAGEDPLQYRLDLLKGHPRLRGVLEKAAQAAGWGSNPGEGRALGIAVHKSFHSYVAQVAEISLEGESIRVHRVVCAVDCGLAVNPDIVRAQMESGIIFGLTAALYGQIDFADGKVVQSNFHDYPLLRMNETPDIEVIITDSDEAPTGVGEPGLPPIAPAVGNAYFRLTGKRLRQLPLKPGSAA